MGTTLHTQPRMLRAFALLLLALLLIGLTMPAQAQKKTNKPFTVVPLQITNVVVQNGQLVAIGSLGSTTFTAPITLGATPSATGACPILDLSLAPIHLDLLGLVVDTSAICLDVTAQSGSGNLLGNLLCDIAGLLNQGVTLDVILAGLTPAQLNTLTSGITSLLNNVLGLLTQNTAVAGVSGPSCNILNLALGPVNLNLLGLEVALDNCANGPVTLDVTAVPGSLLGDLLCDLANLLNSGHASSQSIYVTLQQIASAILALI